MKEVKEFHFSMTLKNGFAKAEENKYTLTAKACLEAGIANASKAAFFRAFREVGGNTCASQVLLTGLRLAKETPWPVDTVNGVTPRAYVLNIIVAGLKQAALEKAEQAKADRAKAKADREAAAAANESEAEGAEGAEGDSANNSAVNPLSLVDGLDKLDLAALEAYKANLIVALKATRAAIEAKKAQEAEKNSPEAIVADIKEGVHPLTQEEIEAGDKARRLARLERKGILRAVNE